MTHAPIDEPSTTRIASVYLPLRNERRTVAPRLYETLAGALAGKLNTQNIAHSTLGEMNPLPLCFLIRKTVSNLVRKAFDHLLRW